MSRIDQIETMIVDVPTIRGHVLAMITMTAQTFVLVQVKYSDGSIGLGEGTAIGGLSYGAESPESIQSAIEAYIAPLLIGQNGDGVNAAIQRMDATVKGNVIARAAVEMALWDGMAKRRGVALSDMFGGAIRSSIPVAWTLASGVLEQDIDEAHHMLESQRHRIFKLKIGKRSVREDIAHVGAIKKAVGDRASIRVDANQAWSRHDAVWGLAGLEDVGADLVEQPIAGWDHMGMAQLTKSTKIAVMVDEGLNGPVSALQYASASAADVFAVKVTQSAGLKRAADVCAIADAAGIGLYGGTMLESGVGTAAALQLFACRENLDWGCELFGPLLFSEEILQEPLIFKDFEVHVPSGIGIGVALDKDKLACFDRNKTRGASVSVTK